MARGYCSACGELVEIQPLGKPHDKGTSQEWRPLAHPTPNGEACNGDKRPAGDIKFRVQLETSWSGN